MPYLKTVRVKSYPSAGTPDPGLPIEEGRPVLKPYASREVETTVKEMKTTSKYRRKAFIYKPF